MKKYTFHDQASRGWLPPKVLRIMKLIIVLMTIAFVQVSAHSFGQRVTLSQKNASLESVIKQLRQQTGYDFLLDGDILREVKNIDVQLQNASLEEAIQANVRGRDLRYSIEGRSVVLTKATKPVSVPVRQNRPTQEQREIHGIVINDNGEPLVGASVVLISSDGSTQNTKSGNDGYQPLTASSTAEAMKHVKYVSRTENFFSYKNFANLKRWNTEDAYKETITKSISILDAETQQVENYTFSLKPESPLWIFPFPQTATLYNPNLTQNYDTGSF